jgi:N-acetylmuramoyl-L-alanine amidase
MSHFLHILDPGHGGIDANGNYTTEGKRSKVWPDGKQYFEGVGNRIIAKYVEEELKDLHIDYDFTVLPEDPRDIPLKKRSDKANELNKNFKGKSITWSIHSNGYKKESANGYEVFTSPGQTKSDFIADILFREFAKEFPDLNPRTGYGPDGDVDKEAKFWILTKTHGRAVLLESMFHTNEKECRILMSDEGKRKIAKAIVRAILRVEYLAEQGEIL